MNMEERAEYIKSLDLPQYEVIDVHMLGDIDSVGLLCRHKKSGARVVVISNEDNNKVFSIGFKTPPYNDTGMQHIIEHSTLCGSRKYPVKDPFVELCKGSLNTFLNAMTYPDKTVYPVASCNEVDFKNIMDVYMDAVFYPNMHTNQKIFMQEGWHYELEDRDSALSINGVVYNEMKGVYSSPEDVLSRYTFTSLFPDTPYRFESGGEPGSIPELTYEAFNAYHKGYYHPSNSYIYVYGDIDVKERLDYLDREYLSDFDANDVNIDSDVSLQKPFEKMADETHYFSVTGDEPVENNSYISYNKVIGESTDAKLYLAMQIIDYALIVAPGARLKQALIDKGISTDVYSNFETSVRQPVYSIIAKNCDESKKQLFVDTINETIESIITNGINMRMVDAAINYYEFKYREADFGSFPRGLMCYLTMMDSWLYDDTKPFIHLEELDIFRQIKEEKDKGLFEGIARRYILDNNHGSIVTLIPKRGLFEENVAATEKKLADYKASLTDEQLDEIIKSTKELKEYQDEPSSQEDLMSIPMLKLSDIGKEAERLYIDPKNVGGVTVVHHNMFTSGIAYITLAFNCKNLPEELIPYLGLLASTLGLMDTENFTYPELSNEININCGGINSGAAIYGDEKNYDEYSIYYEVKGKVLYDKIPFMLDIMYEMIFRTKFDDYKRLKDIISRVKSRLESSMTTSGHVVAYTYGTAQFSPTGYYSNKISGYDDYVFMQNIEKNFSSMKEEIVENLNKCIKYIFSKDNLLVSATMNDDGFDNHFTKPMEKFAGQLKPSEFPQAVRMYAPSKVKKAFTSSSQVQYVARCGNFVSKGYKYTGALRVLKIIFSYEYLWLNIRVKGGAYGCMSGFSKNGDTYMVSYRDPNLKKTNEIFENAGDYVENFEASDRDMLKYIIGTIGLLDVPKNPSAKGSRSFSAYICHASYEDYQKTRDEILNADVETIRALAPLVRDTIDENYLCVVGNQATVEQNSELFDVIEPLFK